MEEIIQKINLGFINKNSKEIYKSVIEYFIINKKNVFYQKHPLGFKYHNIGKISSTEELRIHIWDNKNDNQDNDLQIHDHSFDFESFVIFGKIKNIKYNIRKSTESNGFIYQVKFVDNKSCLETISENQKIEVKSTDIISNGNFYFINRNEYHQSENISDFTITLLKISKPINKSANVYSPKKIKEFLTFKRTYLSKNESEVISEIIIDKSNYQINVL